MTTEWVSGVIGLVGVVLGGMLNAVLTRAAENRKRKANSILAARLVKQELELIQDTLRTSIRDGRWGATLDPGLPYHRGLWFLRERSDTSAWSEFKSDLVIALKYEQIESVRKPYSLVDRIALDCVTADPDRPLSELDAEKFREIISAIPYAIEGLEKLSRREP